jgi:hypothetical protein
MLLGRGLTAWVRITRTARSIAPVSRVAPCRQPAVLPDLQADLLQVWTQMALSVRSSEVSS